jgi:hypothetical protein
LSPLEPTTTKVPASGTWYTLFCLTVAIAKEAPDSAKKQSFFSSTPISTPQSILKKCKASPSIKPSAAKKILFEHLPSLSDSEQHSVQTENVTTVNDFNLP